MCGTLGIAALLHREVAQVLSLFLNKKDARTRSGFPVDDRASWKQEVSVSPADRFKSEMVLETRLEAFI